MTGVRKVAIVGAGLAGLACALAAAAAGTQVDLYEARIERVAGGGHLEVGPNMLRALVLLGVGQDCVRAGFPYHGRDLVDSRGRVLAQVATPHLAGPGFPAALGITLVKLEHLLLQAAIARGVRLHAGREVTVRESDGGVLLHAGETILPGADLVIAACGAHSALRCSIFPQAPQLTESEQSWWYTLAGRPTQLQRPRFTVGPDRRKTLLVPVSEDQAGLAYVHSGPIPKGEELRMHLEHALSGFPEMERHVARNLPANAPVTVRPVRAGILLDPWSMHGVLAVGSCARTLAPHFAQAAAQAIEDGVVLGQLLPLASSAERLARAFSERRLARSLAVHQLTSTAVRWDLAPERNTNFPELLYQLSEVMASPA